MELNYELIQFLRKTEKCETFSNRLSKNIFIFFNSKNTIYQLEPKYI